MRISSKLTLVAAALALLLAPALVGAEPIPGDDEGTDDGSKASSDDPEIDEGGKDDKEPAPEPSVVGYEASDKNEDYKPKSDTEGSTWTFDPQKVELSGGESDTGTNFQGARILKGDEDVLVKGAVTPGSYGDVDNSRYAYWQGSTYFFGGKNEDTGNSVDGIVEFFWFESSIPRGSDFYVAQVKVKSSPNPWDKWVLAKEPNFIDDYIFFWNDVQPAQHLDVFMEPGGAHGALRWDFCVPFETYKWEPVKTMQISEKYGAGYSLEGTGNVTGKASKQFKEGGAVADLTGDAKIQAKGYVNNDFKVESQYTITLYKWQMLVQSGGEDIHYKLVVLPHDKEKDNQSDSGYYEYFVVLQAERGTPVHIDEIQIGGMFRHTVPLWFDSYEGVSASIHDIWITPPRGTCLPGDVAPPDTCKVKGVCGLAQPECEGNDWVCPVMNVFEAVEQTCDGLDNDCDGLEDEDIHRECQTACGTGYETCAEGKFIGCDAVQPQPEICGDGVDNDCDGVMDNGCEDDTPVEDPIDDGHGTDGTDDTEVPNIDTPADDWDQDNTQSPPKGTTTNPGKDPKSSVPDAGSGCTTGAGGPGAPLTSGLLLLLAMLSLSLLRRRREPGNV